MRKKHCITLIIIIELVLINYTNIYSQIFEVNPGSNASVLGRNTTSYESSFNVFNNSSLLINKNKNKFFTDFSFGNLHSMKELYLVSVASGYSFNNSAVGIGVYSIGSNAFSQYSLAMSFAKKLSPTIQSGIVIQYLGTYVLEYGNFGTPTFGLNTTYKLSDKTNICIQISNPHKPKIDQISDQRLRSSLQMGTSHVLSKETSLYTQLSIYETNDISISTGISYKPNQKHSFLIGYQTLARNMGFGYNYHKNIHIQIGFLYHARLGYSYIVETNLFRQ
jgi:hypothetical protein